MKILITGINGFVGTYLQRELILRGHDVYGIDISSLSANTVSVNLSDPEQLKSTLAEISPDAVIHLAAISNVDHSNISLIYNTNFHGTLNLLTSCSRLSNRPKFLFVSSSQVYGNVPEIKLPIEESFSINPVNHYGASKAAGEMIVKAFSAEYEIEYAIARPFNHTGPGQTDRFVIPKIINAFKRGNDSIELGNIHTIRDFTDVRDVVKGYADIIENFRSGEIFNIASESGIRISDVVDILIEITGHNMKIIQKEVLVRKNEIRSVIGSAHKIQQSLGWNTEYTIKEMLENMLKNALV